jgi:Enoyl-CoA hydratase/isomerase
VICVLHGASVGIAIDISSACDIRVAAQDTKFSIKEVDIGLAADLGTLQRFPRVVGNDSWTRELAFTGRFFSAKEALERGFLSYVVDSRESGVAKAMEIAKLIVSKSPIAVQGTKGQLDYARDHTIREGTFSIRQGHLSDIRIGICSDLEFLQSTDSGMDTCKSPLIVGCRRVNYRFLPKTETKILKVVNSQSTNSGTHCVLVTIEDKTALQIRFKYSRTDIISRLNL